MKNEEYIEGTAKLSTKLYNKDTWVLRTTDTGIEINPKVTWYSKVYHYFIYLYYKAKGIV